MGSCEVKERGHLAKIALAAWANVRPDQMPPSLEWINHPNDANRQAWERVAAAIADDLNVPALRKHLATAAASLAVIGMELGREGRVDTAEHVVNLAADLAGALKEAES